MNLNPDKRDSVDLEIQVIEMLNKNIPAQIIAKELKVDLEAIEEIERSVASRDFKEEDLEKLSVEEMQQMLETLRSEKAKLKRQNVILKAAKRYTDR
ncbi:MAG TPA: hypothetical protein VK041_11010 [Opitutales bacterium]|nr:hypothetical protein [Opitutales bacterium]